MMWLARLKPLVAVGAALILVTTGFAVQGRQQPAAEGAPGTEPRILLRPKAGATPLPDIAANRALARQQVALIDEAWAMLTDMGRNARISIADPAFSLWGHRRLESLRKAGAGKAEIVAALEKYINNLKEHLAIAKARKESARGTEVETHDVVFRLLEAEIWLNEEKAR